VTGESKQAKLDQLRASLQVLETQRTLLGDAIEPALDAVRRQMAVLEAELAAAAPAEERRIVTALFSDIVGSTSLAEKMDAEDWHSLIAAVHAMGGRTIQKHAGLVLQYLGDGLLAIFGATAPSERDVEEAIRAALDLQAGLAELSTQPPLQMRVGIHTGLVILGRVGSETTHEYTAIGDAMNLAARLQSAAPPGGIIISHAAYRYVRGVFDLTPQPPINVKGKSEPIQTYIVQRARPHPFRTVTRGVAGIETITIGREAELKKLRAAFGAAQSDRTVAWAQIIGEPGMGKSRLLSDTRDALDLLPDRFRWLRARAFQGDEKHAFSLVRRLWFDLFQIAEDAPLPEAEARWLDQFLARRGAGHEEAAHALGLLVGLPFIDSPYIGALRHDPAQVKGRAYVVSRELFAIMRAELPIIVLLEDLHWADPSSWDYLTQLLLTADESTPPHGLLVIGTARPEWNPPAALLKHPAYLSLTLTALTADACQALVAALLQHVENVSEEIIQLIVDRSEGVPYYVEEIINWFLDRGIIARSGEAWRFDHNRLHEASLPTTLQHLLSTRLSSLADNERLSLQRGSIFGRNFWEGGLAALGTPDCAPTLAQLQPRGFIELQPESSLAGEREWSFHHNLLREATYESILKRDRRELHKEAATWLEKQARQAGRLDEFVGILAEHAERAGQEAAATAWYLRAGARARAQGAFLEARSCFERALELTPPADHAQRWEARLGLNDVVAHLGEVVAHRQCVEALLELSQYLGPAYVAEAHYRQALLFDSAGNYPAALDEYHIALTNAQQTQVTSLEVRMSGMLAICQGRLGDIAAAEVTVQQALSRMHEIGEIDSTRLLTNLAIYYAESGDLARAAQMHEEQVALCQKLGERSGQANGLLNLGYDYLCLGRYDEGRVVLEQAQQLCDTFGARRERAYARLNLGLIHWRSGDLVNAQQVLQSVQIELAALNDTFAQAAGLSYWAIVLEAAHDLREAQQYYQTAHGIFTQAGTRGYAADALAGLARCALALNDRATVQRHVTELWNTLRLHSTQGMEFPVRAYLTCVECFTALGEAVQTRQAIEAGYRELIERAEKISQLEWGRSYLFNVPEHRALIELWEQIAAPGGG
jgi:class 3 adenylate cyclase/predicted ATPase